MRKTVTHIDCPKEWKSTDDFNSHRELLYIALKNTKGIVVEVGMGFGSSPLISWECYEQGRHFEAFETNKDWWEEVSMKAGGDTTVINLVKDYSTSLAKYLDTKEDDSMGLFFIDCAPGEIRKHLIRSYNETAKVIIVHDTEIGAEYVYGMSDVLSKFKYRLDYQPIGKPHTTVVSNSINVCEWIH